MKAYLFVRKNTFKIRINQTFSQFSAVFFILFSMLSYHAISQTGTQVSLKITNPDFVCGLQTVDITAPAVTAGSDAGLDFSYWLDQSNTIPVANPTAVVGGTYYIKGQRTSPFGIAVLPVIVEVNPIPTTSLIQPTCATLTGTITVSAPTGAGMTYSIDNTTYTNTTGIFTSVIEGKYSVTAKSVAGCISPSKSVTILTTTPSAPTVGVTQPTCSVTTGTITVTAPTGIGMTYSIDGLTYSNTTGIFTPVVAGNYNLTVKNSTGCLSASTSVTINTQPATPPSPTVSVTQPTCSVLTGTITVTSPTGTGMTYSIDGLNYTNTTGIFTTLVAGNYNVTAKNSTGCLSASTSVTINTQPATPPSPTVSVTQPTCSVLTGTITVTAPTGTGMTYSIDGLNYTNTTGIFTSVAEGIYKLTVKNSTGCISANTIVTIQSSTPSAPNTNVTQPTCSVATGTITVTAPTGTGMTYSIDGINYTNTTGIFTSVVAGTYNITVKNAGGCISLGANVTINTQPVTPVAPTANTIQPTCTESTGTITITAPTDIGMTYSIDGLTYTNTTGVFTNLDAGTYNVTARNANYCISANTNLTVNAEPDVVVPSVFTPNADGIHDLFEINCIENYPNAEIQIFNRNGNLIFKNIHYGHPDLWDGRSENNWNFINSELPVGTYYYILKLGNGKVLSGFVFLAK